MPPSMHQSYVPVFTRYLNQLSALVQRADAHIAITGAGPAALLEARLAPDMAPFLSRCKSRTTSRCAPARY